MKENPSAYLQQIRVILGKKYLKTNISSDFDFIRLAMNGVNSNTILNFKKHFELSMEDTASMLNVSEPTIYRWTKTNKNLDRNHSIKLMEITELFVRGIDVFGHKDNFFKWLSFPNKSLGGMEPQILLGIPEGISKLKDLIGRIEHGVYS